MTTGMAFIAVHSTDDMELTCADRGNLKTLKKITERMVKEA